MYFCIDVSNTKCNGPHVLFVYSDDVKFFSYIQIIIWHFLHQLHYLDEVLSLIERSDLSEFGVFGNDFQVY